MELINILHRSVTYVLTSADIWRAKKPPWPSDVWCQLIFLYYINISRVLMCTLNAIEEVIIRAVHCWVRDVVLLASFANL